jgi:hypothetical protein
MNEVKSERTNYGKQDLRHSPAQSPVPCTYLLTNLSLQMLEDLRLQVVAGIRFIHSLSGIEPVVGEGYLD